MATKEKFCGVLGKKIGSVFGDADFGAASIGDESVRRGEARDFGKKIESGADGKSDVNEIGVFDGRAEVGGEGCVNGVARLSFAEDVWAVPAGDMHVGRVLAKG
jgi:hypothetical protein